MRILIDTSIWSRAFRRKKIKSEDKKIIDSLKYLIDEFIEVIIGPVRQDLLSGISDKTVFDDLKEKMKGFTDFPVETLDYELAAEYSNVWEALKTLNL
jgi:predicted nucleic acid-binding protein